MVKISLMMWSASALLFHVPLVRASLAPSNLRPHSLDLASAKAGIGNGDSEIKSSRRHGIFNEDLMKLDEALLDVPESTDNRDLQDTSEGMERCMRLREIIEWEDFGLGRTCTCSDQGDTVILSCGSICERCSADGGVCTTSSSTLTYEAVSGVSISSSQTATYSEGRSDVVVLSIDGIDTCSVTINGELCASCVVNENCPVFDCSNIATVSDADDSPAPPVDLCDRPTDLEGVMQFANEEFSSGGCEGNPPIANTCEQYDGLGPSTYCRCTPYFLVEGTYIANCKTFSSRDVICNDDMTICGELSLQVLFDPAFSLTDRAGIGFGYEVTSGPDQTSLSMIQPVNRPGVCFATAGDQLCDGCIIADCEEGPRPAIDCDNLFTDSTTQDPSQCVDSANAGTPFAFLDAVLNRAAETPSPPIEMPVDSPVDAPADSPAIAPADSPIDPPAEAPVISPVDAPATTPVTSPVNAPVAPPTDAPAIAPVDVPVDVPVDMPVDAPVDSPVVAPIAPPENAPSDAMSPPMDAPTSAPIASPVAPTEGLAPNDAALNQRISYIVVTIAMLVILG